MLNIVVQEFMTACDLVEKWLAVPWGSVRFNHDALPVDALIL
jgi:hypothetical protein